MKKLLTATAISAMLAAGVAVAMQAEPAAPRKAPQTKAQLLARADARFDALDTDRNGQLSAQEREAGMDRARAARAERGDGERVRKGHRGGGLGERMLARADVNGDGLISRAEHRAVAEARFARIDANGYETVDAGERGKRGMGKRHGRNGHRGMMNADANKDGVVTRAEFDAASDRRFARRDANRDGKIDRADDLQRRSSAPAPATD